MSELLERLSKKVTRMQMDQKRHQVPSTATASDDSEDEILYAIKKSEHIDDKWSEFVSALCSALEEKVYSPVGVNEYLPRDRLLRYRFVESIKCKGMPIACCLFTKTLGSNMESLHFMWLRDEEIPDHDTKQLQAIRLVKEMLPSYHSKSVRQMFIQQASALNVKPGKARILYKLATDDCSAPANKATKEVDERLLRFVETEDETIVLDLRRLNKRESVYDGFFDKASQIISDQVELAVDDRRHDPVTHLAAAMSTRDLYE